MQSAHPVKVQAIPLNGSIGLRVYFVAMGGGYTRLALPSKVTVQRTVAGELKVFRLDAESMALDPTNKPFMILPGDTITVGERVF